MHLFLNVSLKKTTKFHEKILFESGVINLQIPMTKYLLFQYSVNNNHEGLFSADYRVLIKVLRQEKGYGAKKIIAEFFSEPDLGEAAGACVSQPDS